jgi:hypothetical protein
MGSEARDELTTSRNAGLIERGLSGVAYQFRGAVSKPRVMGSDLPADCRRPGACELLRVAPTHQDGENTNNPNASPECLFECWGVLGKQVSDPVDSSVQVAAKVFVMANEEAELGFEFGWELDCWKPMAVCSTELSNDLGIYPISFGSAWCEIRGASGLEAGDIQNWYCMFGCGHAEQGGVGRFLINDQDRIPEGCGMVKCSTDLGSVVADSSSCEDTEFRIHVVKLMESLTDIAADNDGCWRDFV